MGRFDEPNGVALGLGAGEDWGSLGAAWIIAPVDVHAGWLLTSSVVVILVAVTFRMSWLGIGGRGVVGAKGTVRRGPGLKGGV